MEAKLPSEREEKQVDRKGHDNERKRLSCVVRATPPATKKESSEKQSADEHYNRDNGGVPAPLSRVINSRADDQRNNDNEHRPEDDHYEVWWKSALHGTLITPNEMYTNVRL
jgi:hypothetical protein